MNGLIMTHTLWRHWIKSTLFLLTVHVVSFSASAVHAHELVPAIADLFVENGEVRIEIELNAEAMLSGIDQTAHDDSREAPGASEYDQLRELTPDELGAIFERSWAAFARDISLAGDDTSVVTRLERVDVPPVGETDLPRATRVTVTAAIPAGTETLTFGWSETFGPLVLRQQGVEAPYTGYLTQGALSAPIPITGGGSASASRTFIDYIVIGFEHIIPKGLDHILFVLGIFFFSTHLRPLIWQVTAFTLAHTVTLAMGILGVVSIPAGIVEPLIAASIVYVGIENITSKGHSRWRPYIVFGFGLLHGLGFASVLGDIGLNPTTFVTGLVGFNVGVELGQLAVIALAYVFIGFWFGSKPWYRAYVAIPASLCIAAVGAWWFVERVFL